MCESAWLVCRPHSVSQGSVGRLIASHRIAAVVCAVLPDRLCFCSCCAPCTCTTLGRHPSPRRGAQPPTCLHIRLPSHPKPRPSPPAPSRAPGGRSAHCAYNRRLPGRSAARDVRRASSTRCGSCSSRHATQPARHTAARHTAAAAAATPDPQCSAGSATPQSCCRSRRPAAPTRAARLGCASESSGRSWRTAHAPVCRTHPTARAHAQAHTHARSCTAAAPLAPGT